MDSLFDVIRKIALNASRIPEPALTALFLLLFAFRFYAFFFIFSLFIVLLKTKPADLASGSLKKKEYVAI